MKSSLNTLAENEIDYIQNHTFAYTEQEEIDSAKSGFVSICQALGGNPENIVSLLNHDGDDPLIVGHPELEDGDDSYNFSKFFTKIGNGTQIWEDEYWSSSPGSNQIYLHEITLGGKPVKIAVWTGAGWDYPLPYILANDLV